jgi:hypothetical protein
VKRGLHPDAQARRAEQGAIELMGLFWWACRRGELARLPTVQWKGQTLYTLRCCATSGRGSHLLNVPESLIWQIVSLKGFYCPYHAGDTWGIEAETGGKA